MKTILAALLLAFGANSARAYDVITPDGRRFRECSGFVARGTVLHFTHMAGQAKIPCEQLPANLLRMYFPKITATDLKRISAERAVETERAALLSRALERDRTLRAKYAAQIEAGKVASFIVTMNSLSGTGFIGHYGQGTIHVTRDLGLTQGDEWYGYLQADGPYEYTTVLGARSRIAQWIPLEARCTAISRLEFERQKKEPAPELVAMWEDSIIRFQRALETK